MKYTCFDLLERIVVDISVYPYLISTNCTMYVWILINISLKFVSRGRMNIIPALVRLLTQIWVARLQRVSSIRSILKYRHRRITLNDEYKYVIFSTMSWLMVWIYRFKSGWDKLYNTFLGVYWWHLFPTPCRRKRCLMTKMGFTESQCIIW